MPRAGRHGLAADALFSDAALAELLRAVRNGRLWLNVTRVDRADARYRELIRANACAMRSRWQPCCAERENFSRRRSWQRCCRSTPGAL
jgi:hypothetical protein